MMNTFTFEDYWKPWETASQWELKREFIETYKNMFNEERLLCLAQAYSNIILMNCRYPNPVMQQISQLAKPLQKYKKFQEVNSTIGMKRSINEEQIDLMYSEENYSTYEHSERSFKQIKSTIYDEQSTSAFFPASTTMLQPSVKQCRNTYSMPPYQQSAQMGPKSEQAFKTSSLGKIKEPQPPFQVKDIFIEKDIENRILSALGLSFIQRYAEKIKSCVSRFSIPIEILQCASYKLGIRKKYGFEISVDPDSPNHATTYFCKFFVKNVEIARETSRYKKKSKALCAEAAINTILKLATVDKVNSVKKYRPTVHRKIDTMEVLEIFKRNIINRSKEEPAIIALKSIASLVDMERYLAFRVVSNVISSVITEYTCRFFLYDILISSAVDLSAQSAKNIAAEFGLIKLSNLDEYEIHQNKLKKKLNPNDKSVYSASSYSSKKTCDSKINNSEKTPFILNKVLFDSSKKDGFLVVEKDSRKSSVQKEVRTLVSESAGFCGKKFFLEVEDVPDTKEPYKKVKVIIGGEVVGIGIAFSTDEAKTAACAKAYVDFKKKYYTLRVKDCSFDGFIVTRDQVFDGEPYSKNVLSRNYLGCTTLRRRLKKKKRINNLCKDTTKNAKSNFIEATAEQPLNADTEPKQKHHDLHLFRQHIETMVQEFRESEDYCDLVFSEDFSQVEKIEIMKIAKRLQLRAHFHEETDGTKFVSVKHRLDVRKLLDYLVKNNGCNCKFELIDCSKTVI